MHSECVSARIDRLMRAALVACQVVTVVPLFLILGYITARGLPGLDASFFTGLPNDPPGQRGLRHALVGSGIIVGLATAFAVPAGVLAAVFLAEYRNHRLVAPVREWAERKRWLFVLNKIDLLHEDSRKAVAEDWAGRLGDLPFETREGDRFVVSATEPEREDLPRLRETLLGGCPGDPASWGRERFIGQALFALRAELLEPLRETSRELSGEEARLNRELAPVANPSRRVLAARRT